MFQELETHPLPARPMLKVSVPVEDDLPDQVLPHIQGSFPCSIPRPWSGLSYGTSGGTDPEIDHGCQPASRRARFDEYSFGFNRELRASI